MTSNGVMVIVTATPLIMAAMRAVRQLWGLNHCRHTFRHRFTSAAYSQGRAPTSLWVFMGSWIMCVCADLCARDPVFSRAERGQLSRWPHRDPRHGPVHPPPQTRHSLTPVDGQERARHALKNTTPAVRKLYSNSLKLKYTKLNIISNILTYIHIYTNSYKFTHELKYGQINLNIVI